MLLSDCRIVGNASFAFDYFFYHEVYLIDSWELFIDQMTL